VIEQIQQLLASLTLRQKMTIAIAAVVVIAGVWGLSRWNTERDFKPLFTGLAPEDAGAVVARLKESGQEFRLSDNGTSVMVPSGRVAELRLELAGAGLPKTGRIGFELFDRANLGTSEFAEQVNYHRALEGELERSVMSLREVEGARIHITLAKESIFTELRQPAKASVLLKLKPGQKLSPANVAAVCHLVANGVGGLAAESISVLDEAGNLLNRPRQSLAEDGSAGSEAMLDYRKTVERDVQVKIASTLEPLLGPDHFRIGVSADVDFSKGEQSEEVFDPTKSVMVTSQRTEDGSGASLQSGVPGTASNLPRPTSRPGSSWKEYSRRTENIAYQSSRTVKRVTLPQGNLKRLSISVLIDHGLRWEGTAPKLKKVIEPPTPQKLKVIRDVVAAAAGFQTDRGDQLVVESFPFDETLRAEPIGGSSSAPADPANFGPPWLKDALKNKNFVVLGVVGGLGIVALVGFLLFLLTRGRGKAKRGMVASVDTGAPAVAAPASGSAPAALPESPEAIQKQIEAKLAEQQAIQAKQAAEQLMALKQPTVTTKKMEVLSKHITQEAKKDPQAMAQVVRSWLNAPER
jgi:flagellar M-ring protein FliF